MIASMIAKWVTRHGFLKYNEDDFDVDAILAWVHNDIIWDGTSELGIGESIKGKEAFGDWLRKWKEEFPKRTFDLKNICFSAWPLWPTKVITLQWTLTQTDRQGKTFRYDGATVAHTKNFKFSHVSEYISFADLPKLSTLIEPSAEA